MSKDLIIVTFIASLGGFLLGFDNVVIHATLPYITTYFDFVPYLDWIVISVGLAGSVPGAYFIGRYADRFGRRDMMKVVAALFFVSAIGTGLSDNLPVFILFRIIKGISIGAVSVLSVVYIAEIAPPKSRGRILSGFPLAVMVGILCASISDHWLMDTGVNNWRMMHMAGAIPALLFFILLFFTARTPRWLMKKGYDRETSFVIRLVNPGADFELLMKEIKVTFSLEKKGEILSIFRKPFTRAIQISLFFSLFAQFTGFHLLNYYVTEYNKEAGYFTDPTYSSCLIFALVNIVFILFAMTLIDKVGRKVLLVYGSAGMVIVLAVLGVLVLSGNNDSLLFLLLILGLAGLYSVSQGVVIWVYIAEMFPNKIRAVACSFAYSFYWFFNLVTLLLFSVTSGAGRGILLLFFASMTFASIFFFRKYVIETKGKSLEALESTI